MFFLHRFNHRTALLLLFAWFSPPLVYWLAVSAKYNSALATFRSRGIILYFITHFNTAETLSGGTGRSEVFKRKVVLERRGFRPIFLVNEFKYTEAGTTPRQNLPDRYD